MGDLLSFPKKPTQPEEWPWPVLKDIIEAEVKRSAPEIAPEAVVARMKPDVSRWIDLAQDVSSGICSEETRGQLFELLSEAIASRLTMEMERRQA